MTTVSCVPCKICLQNNCIFSKESCIGFTVPKNTMEEEPSVLRDIQVESNSCKGKDFSNIHLESTS